MHPIRCVALACALAANAAFIPTAHAAPKRPAKAATGAVDPAAAPAASAKEAELMQKLDRLSQELESVKGELAEIKRQQAEQQRALQQASAVSAPSDSTASAQANAGNGGAASQQVANGPDAANGAAWQEPATVLTGYGEINYNHYNRDKSKSEADVRRFVLGLQHRFDPKTKMVSELEVEHSVSSAEDQGEVEVEQAYVERELSRQWALRAGLFLIPSGLLNENHEPTAYYGVERNFVETAIIPSTWREGGLQFVGNFDNGLTLQTGLSTSFRMSKWIESDDGPFHNAETAQSPLGSVHQEMSKAKAKDLATFVALNWRGVPGLQLGGSWFAGNSNQGEVAPLRNGLRVTVWDLHARYQLSGFDLSALYARGTIGGTVDVNPIDSGPDFFPIPQRFDGGYVQAAYKLWSSGDLALSPFARIERFNTRRSYADLGPGVTPDAADTEGVYTLGANLYVGQGLVFKIDVQRFKLDKNMNRVDLGVGWSF